MLLQGQWVMHGGDPAVAGDTLEMFTFDFSNLSWSQAKLTVSPLQHRMLAQQLMTDPSQQLSKLLTGWQQSVLQQELSKTLTAGWQCSV